MKTNLRQFQYAAGYSPDDGKTQYVLLARSMKDLHYAWDNQNMQILALDEEKVVKIEISKAEKAKP